jgi:type IV secretion system protein VirD4
MVRALLAADALFALAAGTQWWLWRHHYGLTPIRAPYHIIVWELHHVEREPLVVMAIALTLALAATIGCLPGPRPPPLSGAFGTAAWDDGRALADGHGLAIGRTSGRVLRYDGDGHLLTVAPTRSGKGVGAVVPNLLTYPGSVVVTDPKGENYAVTAARRRALGSRVVAYDPFGIVATARDRATYNPLDRVDVTLDDAVDEARLIADMLIVPDGRAEPFWEEEARAVLVGLILHVAGLPDRASRTLATVRASLTLPPAGLKALLARMSADPGAGGLVRRAAAQLSQKSPRERAAVMSTAQSHTHFLDSPRMAACLAVTQPSPVLASARSTIYLILPPDRLDGYRRWLRLMIASLLHEIIRARTRRDQRVVFLLDEFAHLGRMRPIEQGVSLAGGYGVGFWLLVQDLAQLRAVYGESWHTFLANADVLQAFGINDWDTAEHLSKLAGDATVRVATESRSRGVSHGRLESTQAGEGRSLSERGRRLITADEVRRLPPGRQLLFVRGRSPIATDRLDYRHDAELAPLAAPNPLHARPV